MPQVIWSKKAIESLLEYQDYIAEDSESRALKWTNEIIELTKKLEVFPNLGKEYQLNDIGNIRRLIIGDYFIYYEYYENSDVKILVVKHSSMLEN